MPLRTSFLVAATLLACLSPLRAQAPVVDGLTNCTRADNGRPVCVLVATGRFTFVSDEFLRRYQQAQQAQQQAPRPATPVPVPAAGSVGPTFDCGRATDMVGQAICADPGLRRLDVEVNQPFNLLRHLRPDLIPELRAEAQATYREMATTCGLPPRGPLTAETMARARPCLAALANSRRNRLLNMMAQDPSVPRSAFEEAQRAPEEHFRIQARLVELGWLPPDAAIDGAYGTATRTAIQDFQRSVSLPPDGVVNNTVRAALLQQGRPLVPPNLPAQATAPPAIAPAPAQAPRPNSARLAALTREGQPDDLLLVVNLAPDAPNTSRNLDGEIVFRATRAELCRLSDINADAARGMAAEGWLAARRIPVQATAIGTCNGRDFRTTDAAFLRRGDVNALDARFLAGLATALDAGTVEVGVLESAANRAAAMARRATARQASAQRAADGAPGAGYLIFDNQGQNACYVSEDNAAAWQRAMEERLGEFHLDLEARLQLRAVPLGSNDAFIFARRGDCRVVVGEARSLHRIATAAQRDRVVAQFGAVWFQPPAVAGRLATPGPAAAAAGVERAASDALARLEAAGDPADLMLLVNTGSAAPNATVNLAGEVRFMSARAQLCAVATLQPTLAQELALEDWLRARNVPASAAARQPCATQEFPALDGILLRRGELTRLDPILFNSLARAAAGRGMAAQLLLSEPDAAATADRLAAASIRNAGTIEAGGPGIGIVFFENPSRQICVVSDRDTVALERMFQPHRRAIELEADQRGPFGVSAQDADSAFIATRQRQACRAIAGPSESLRKILAASERDGLAHRVGALWLAPEAAAEAASALAAERAEAARQAQARETAAQQERQQREIRERNAGIERARRTEELRNASRATAVAMQDATREALRQLFATQAQPQNWLGATFAGLSREANRRRLEQWRLDGVESTIHEYGLGQWSGRRIDTAVIRSEIQMRNADIGRYEAICALTGYQNDVEFNRVRDSRQAPCTPAGEAEIRGWLQGLGFESRWNAP